MISLTPLQLFWLVVVALGVGWQFGHFEGLRCSCSGPRKTKGEVK